MNRATALAWSWLNVLNKRRYDKLLQRFDSLDDALLEFNEELLLSIGCREEGARAALTRLAAFDLDAYDRTLQKAGVLLLALDDDAYPERLRQTADPPIFLHVQGDAALLDKPGMAIVGTRMASAYGRRAAQECAAACVRAGLTTISGLAAGIDGEVAKETLREHGAHVAVVGHGLQHTFPAEHDKLRAEVLARGGTLVSEYAHDTPVLDHQFVGRNRIIAGLALGTAVIEAPAKSGALHTARFALDEGREVLAAPGPLFDDRWTGCLRLIADGSARIITAPEDVPAAVGAVAPSAPMSAYEPQSEAESKVLAALTTVPQTVDALVPATGLAASALSATLTMLELAGAARNVGGGEWVRA
jgi:DNA processing protein